MVLLGWHLRLGSLLLMLFLLPATLIFHRFWVMEPSHEQITQMHMFMKNLAIFGGLLYIFVFGSGCWALRKSHPWG